MSNKFAGRAAAPPAGSGGACSSVAAATPPPATKVTRARPARRRYISQIPASITGDPRLKAAMAALPDNYNFEVAKTVWRIQQMKARTVALQFPEGLLMYACVISDIVEEFTGAETVIMGDVTYGACCVDDLCAAALDCELLVHYGHSCLVPIDRMATEVLYVFVEITIDTPHLVDTVLANLPPETRIALCGTIQFAGALYAAQAALSPKYAAVDLPQCRPLSAGEVLGCTSPDLKGYGACVFVADGRFHPESVLIANPGVPLYRYDPYSKAITRERYDHAAMHRLRRAAIESARDVRHWGIVLGTLGRQGNPDVMAHLEALLAAKGCTCVVVLMSEVFPKRLAAFEDVGAWVQVCCPRLSIDWGYAFAKPLLAPYEAEVALGAREWVEAAYPMDNYAKAGGSYANYATPAARAAQQESLRSKCCQGGGGGGGGGAEAEAECCGGGGAEAECCGGGGGGGADRVLTLDGLDVGALHVDGGP